VSPSLAEAASARRVSLSLLMPAFNEEHSVERAVGRAVDALERAGYDFEVIVIDDGSTDGTGRIADRLAAADSRIRVLHNERNLNYGISLCRGFAAARCEWILHDGMDLPLDPEDIVGFAEFFDDADVVVARRHDRAAHSPWRKLTSVVNHSLLRVLFAPSVSDLNFVQFYRRSFVQSVDVVSTSPAFVTPELIMRAERTGKRVRELGAEFRAREAGSGHFGKPRDIAWTLKDMLRLRVRTLLRGWGS
jgi:glycosyltransferase involved in cell wall biosynthesis